MHTTNRSKCSFTLIELIIAILIIGVSFAAIPNILFSSAHSITTIRNQSTVNDAFSLVNFIQTVEWDEENTIDDNYLKILHVSHGDSYLQCQGDGNRTGVAQLNNNSGATCANNNASTIGVDANDNGMYDDIDDFDGYQQTSGNYQINIHASYISDSANYNNSDITYQYNQTAQPTTNLKLLTIQIAQSNNPIAILRYISANIGATSIYYKQQ
ncbi:MAG: hypothetical protein GXO40_04930 [Epsilonproteobacteria bacterium]|nr:hypothetical protein [Campylobacterota bacterium]